MSRTQWYVPAIGGLVVAISFAITLGAYRLFSPDVAGEVGVGTAALVLVALVLVAAWAVDMAARSEWVEDWRKRRTLRDAREWELSRFPAPQPAYSPPAQHSEDTGLGWGEWVFVLIFWLSGGFVSGALIWAVLKIRKLDERRPY
jgi:hypothetical protein